MAVTVAGVVESVRTDTSDPMTWSHNSGTASPQGVVIMFMHGTSSTDHVVSVTYGTRSLTRIQRNTDTSTEPGAAEIWFAGGGIPTGTQTVTADLASGTTDDIHGVSITLDAAFDLVKLSNGGVNENTANPSVALTNTSGNSAMAFAAMYSGLSTIASLAAGTDCTFFTTSELSGNFTSGGFRQTTASTENFTIAVTSATDDVAFAAANFGESVVAAAVGSYSITGTAATLKVGFKLIADVGSYAITGTAATLARGYTLAVASGLYYLNGQDLTFRFFRLSAASGSYELVGSQSLRAFTLALASGVYSISGVDATLTYAQHFTLTVDSGVYALSGTDVTFIYTPAGGATGHLLAIMGMGG